MTQLGIIQAYTCWDFGVKELLGWSGSQDICLKAGLSRTDKNGHGEAQVTWEYLWEVSLTRLAMCAVHGGEDGKGKSWKGPCFWIEQLHAGMVVQNICTSMRDANRDCAHW